MTDQCQCTGPGFCKNLGRQMPPARFHECRDKPEYREMFRREEAAGKYDPAKRGQATVPAAPKGDRGFGDTLARFFRWIGFKKRKGCGCGRRQELLNAMLPYNRSIWRARLFWWRSS